MSYFGIPIKSQSQPMQILLDETLQYLQACHNLFEEGFLSHERITDMESTLLKNIDEGYEYFTSWLSTLLSEGTYLHNYCVTFLYNALNVIYLFDQCICDFM